MSLTAGVDLGGTKVSAACIDARGRVKKKVVLPTDPADGSSSVVASLERLLSDGREAAAIGVGVAGFVDLDGRVVLTPNLFLTDGDIGEAVASRFRLPVIVENDANCAALAEFRLGAGRERSPMLMLTLGTGVGGGLIIQGQVYRGANGFAAEFGHMVLQTDGPQCPCGRRGCLEALASGTAIATMGAEAMTEDPDGLIARLSGSDPSKVSGELVADAAAAGDFTGRSVMERAGEWLGLGLAGLVNALDPASIVVGGGVVADEETSELILAPARSIMQKELATRQVPQVVRAQLGNDAGMIGAAALAADMVN